MNNEEKTPIDQNAVVEIEETELEAILAGLPVRSGLQAGRQIQPCI